MSGSELMANPAKTDLARYVTHAHAVGISATVEQAHALMAKHGVDFVAVLDGGRLVGVCARRELTDALSSRFGFALNARRAVTEHLSPVPFFIRAGTELTEVFKGASARGAREFYDDAVLIDALGGYVGMIPMRTLVQLQTEVLLRNIDRLENSRAEIASKNRQIEEDLRMACEVQSALLPGPFVPVTTHAGVVLGAHRYLPAGEMSGDFLDVRTLSDGRVALLICDVMGHGVRSALITAMVRAFVEGLEPVAGAPAALLTALNARLTPILRQAGTLVFVTAAYAVIDCAARRLHYAQAGHPPPFRLDRGTGRIRAVACTEAQAGPALGLIEEFNYALCTEEFTVGDRIALFTDGVFEAANARGEEFGLERLAATLARHPTKPVGEWLDAAIAAASAFAGQPFADDVCLIAIEIGEPAPANPPPSFRNETVTAPV